MFLFLFSQSRKAQKFLHGHSHVKIKIEKKKNVGGEVLALKGVSHPTKVEAYQRIHSNMYVNSNNYKKAERSQIIQVNFLPL